MAMDFALICTLGVAIVLMVFGIVIFFKFARVALKWLVTIILNSIVGIVLLVLLRFVGVQIPLSLPVLLPVALFGLPGLATILILKYFGVTTF